MNKTVAILFLIISICSCQPKISENTSKYQKQLEEYSEMRFGMFICYNIMSYGAKWGEANYPIDRFNPQKLDANQWAKAALSAGMKFGLLTTKHHEGFCLWDSKYTDYDVASTPYKKDIVRQYVDAFRANGLEPGLYYSIWDSSHGIDKGNINSEAMEFIKGQLTELLTNYGEIKYLVFDGWFWRFGHKEVAFDEIRKLVRELQPNCLITDHTHMQSTFHVDIPYFEGPFGAFPPEDNTMASALGHCSVEGNGWFWSEATPRGLKKNESAESIVDRLKKLENRYCNFMLNCMPNRDGLLDSLYIDLLKEIGNSWEPDLSRPLLPIQQKPIIYEATPVSAFSKNGIANHTFDASKIAGKNYYELVRGKEKPQELKFDFGVEVDEFELISITPFHRCKPFPEASLLDGNITNCVVYRSIDGENFKKVEELRWRADGKMKMVDTKPFSARYIKLEVLDFNGERPIINEMAFGAHSKPLIFNNL